jgi:hypothetical protein
MSIRYGTSLFKRFQAAGFPVQMLKIQYRMHPQVVFHSQFIEAGNLNDFLILLIPFINRLVYSLQKNSMKVSYKMGRDSTKNVRGIPTVALDHFASSMLMGLSPSRLEVVHG